MTEAKKDHIGRRIRMQRLSKGILLEDLAKKSGVCLSSLSRIEKDRIKVRLRDFVAICIALDVNPIAMLCGSDTWNPQEVVL